MRPSVIKVAAWGDYHIRSMCENVLPCLLAPGNLPGLAAMSPTYMVLYVDRQCPPQYQDMLARIDAIPDLKIAVQRLGSIDGTARGARMLLASTERESLGHARNLDADWFDFQSDTIVDSGFLTAVKRRLEHHDAVFGLPFRSRDVTFNELCRGSRDLGPRELYDISLRAMHPVTLNYFVQTPPSHVPADPHQFFFAKSGRFVCRSWQPRPYGLRSRALPEHLMPMTIDTFILAVMDRRRIYIQERVPGDFYLTALDGEQIPTFGDFEMTVSSIVDAIKRFSGGHPDAIRAYVWALHHRCVYHASSPIEVNSAGERETMSEIFRALGQS